MQEYLPLRGELMDVLDDVKKVCSTDKAKKAVTDHMKYLFPFRHRYVLATDVAEFREVLAVRSKKRTVVTICRISCRCSKAEQYCKETHCKSVETALYSRWRRSPRTCTTPPHRGPAVTHGEPTSSHGTVY